MRSGSGFKRPVRIDESLLSQHRHLVAADVCYFLREYRIGAGYEGETNSLILNFKKTPDLVSRPEWAYKERAIETLAGEVAVCLEASRGYFSDATIVPIPPSREHGDPLHDDRLPRLLDAARRHCTFDLDVQVLLRQKRSIPSSSREASRPSVEELIQLYEVRGSARRRIVVFDDVLTTGAHFRAADHHLRRCFPTASVIGLFLARARKS